MRYVPDWEPLAAALKRVMATGATDDDAKLDICRAVADQKVSIRVTVTHSYDHAMGGKVLSGGNVDVPARLDPDDFDWVRSRPLKRWPVGPRLIEHYMWTSGWSARSLDLIELSTRDVRRTLCGDDLAAQLGSALTAPLGTLTDDGAAPVGRAGTAKQESDATKALAAHLKANPQLTAADAKAYLKGYQISARGFQSRIWPAARTRAGLVPKASPGRKPKSSRPP
jgi:hypothetical protein